jgi:hypothetical protein
MNPNLNFNDEQDFHTLLSKTTRVALLAQRHGKESKRDKVIVRRSTKLPQCGTYGEQ